MSLLGYKCNQHSGCFIFDKPDRPQPLPPSILLDIDNIVSRV
jgi:hypothetical protein